MTPKEKAEELVDKYYVTIVSFLNDRMKNENAKKCALIAIDETIKMYDNLNELGLLQPNSIGLELHEIKTEIEKL